MGIVELLLIAIGLAMDAFAVSVVKGLEMKKVHYGDCFRLAFAFGAFQAIMPLIGYFVGSSFAGRVERISHWIAFILLAFVGFKMIEDAIKEGRVRKKIEAEEKAAKTGKLSKDEAIKLAQEEQEYKRIEHKDIIMLAFATSIDAFAVGVSLALTPDVHISFAVTIIGITTFIISFIAVHIGSLVGTKLESKAQLLGGILLVLIGLKIFLEGLGLI